MGLGETFIYLLLKRSGLYCSSNIAAGSCTVPSKLNLCLGDYPQVCWRPRPWASAFPNPNFPKPTSWRRRLCLRHNITGLTPTNSRSLAVVNQARPDSLRRCAVTYLERDSSSLNTAADADAANAHMGGGGRGRT